ncbi:MAG: glycosyltransferase family 4 protein [Hyphomonadaceae bacterium]|nr:glycosyltransferase family 4 protein [Hyphomonadaceae bacterium]
MNATLLALLAVLLASGLTALYMRVMTASRQLEQPNERSMHTAPVPSGAGMAIIATALLLWPLSQRLALSNVHLTLLGAAVSLSALSWLDDRHRLSPGVRLAAHALAAGLLLTVLDPDQRIFPLLPLSLERGLLGLGWLWFINLFNFMDGIDGLAGSEAVAIAAGYLVVVAAVGLGTPLRELAMIIAAASAGYLVWNWHPAKIFMGDTGSIPLGFLLGWLMIDLACRGLWAAALILPLYFAADATLTLLRRLRRGEKPWQPHRQHSYQRAVLGGATPPAVVWRINATNLVLLALALLSIRHPIPSLVAAAVAVAALLAHLEYLARGQPAGRTPADRT